MCIVNLTPNGVVGTPNGRWFLTGAAGGGWSGDLDISCDGISFTTIMGLPSDTIPLDNACGDTSSIYVDLSTFSGGEMFTFTFVSPDSKDYTNCVPSPDPCTECANYTIDIEVNPDDVVEFICTNELATNLYTLVGLDCADWPNVDYQDLSQEDPDFDLLSPCPDKGAFNPANISPGTYVFEFTKDNLIPGCGCLVLLTLVVQDQVSAGSNQEGYLCQNN